MRMRDVARLVGVTERAVQRIVAELVSEGYLKRRRLGRRNSYVVVRNRPLRHELERHQYVGALIAIVCDDTPPAPMRRPMQ